MKTIVSTERNARSSALARAVFAKLRARATNRELKDVVLTMPRSDDVMRVINRGVATVATTTGSHWVDDLQRTDFGEFLGWLAPESAAARVLAMGLSVPMKGHEFKAPTRDSAPATLPWVGEAAPIPVRDATLGTLTLSPRKAGAMSVISREAARTGAESVITTLLREDASKSLDAAFSAPRPAIP